MIFVQALRLHLDEGKGVGWLFALSDKQVGAAIGRSIESRRDAGRWRRWPQKFIYNTEKKRHLTSTPTD